MRFRTIQELRNALPPGTKATFYWTKEFVDNPDALYWPDAPAMVEARGVVLTVVVPGLPEIRVTRDPQTGKPEDTFMSAAYRAYQMFIIRRDQQIRANRAEAWRQLAEETANASSTSSVTDTPEPPSKEPVKETKPKTEEEEAAELEALLNAQDKSFRREGKKIEKQKAAAARVEERVARQRKIIRKQDQEFCNWVQKERPELLPVGSAPADNS